MLSDIEIAQKAKMLPIGEVAKQLSITDDELEFYGKYKAKLSDELEQRVMNNKDGKLVLVTSINPTPAGEGKTTTTVGLGQAMKLIGKNAIIALREPSLGPVFGIKGGAAGGGYAQVVPMEDINLHFTGDMHAITSANNLLCAAIDNHIHHGNELMIDQRQVLFPRCMDMNDRALRHTIIGIGSKVNGIPREDGFIITVASEIMAILCLASDIKDLKERLGRILVAYKYNGEAVFCKDIGVEGAMTALLKDALKPNLVQTLENTPAIMHGGPFANIAHGCNSLRATKLGMKLADYTITEAGFGSDLGAEKFLDIKCRYGKMQPSCIVVVATIRALKYNGGVKKEETGIENVKALEVGLVNLGAHVENMKKYGVPVVVAINKFMSDSGAEIGLLKEYCKKLEVEVSLCDVFKDGGEGGKELAEKVVAACEQEANFKFIYDEEQTIKEKIEKITCEIYGADGVKYSKQAKVQMEKIEKLGLDKLPVCIAKTQYSLSDNPELLGRPTGFEISVTNVKISNGAGFIIVYTGDIMIMPGLPKVPTALKIDVDDNGVIKGLF